MPHWTRLLVAAAVLAIAAPGCGETTQQTTSVAPTNGVVFGEGELPATLPAGFPLPAGSVVGSTMIDTSSGLTEAVVRASAEPGDVADFFSSHLGDAGLEIDYSAAAGDGWRIEFSDGGADGSIEISVASPTISQMVIRYNVS